MNAPVRVLSDGENGAQSGSTGGEQTVSDSNGSAQIGSASAHTRLSGWPAKGDNAQTASAGGTAPQTSERLGRHVPGRQPGASAPVRVLSDGDTATPDDNGPGGRVVARRPPTRTGAAQIGSPSVSAPTRVASDGDDADPPGDVGPGPAGGAGG